MTHLLLVLTLSLLSLPRSQSELTQAQLDSARNLYAEAYMLDLGSDSVQPDTVAANRLYLKAAALGYAPAQNFIGFRMLRGEGIAADPEQGLFWIEQAASNDDVRAAANLGYMLANGIYVEPDDKKAFYWLRRAADKDYAPAMSQLGDFYRDGREVEPDSLKAAVLYMISAEQGLPDAASRLIALSGLHKMPLDDISSQEKVRHYLSQMPTVFAANPEFLTFIARCYALGFGVPYNYDKSLKIYRMAAEAGSNDATEVLQELRGQFPDHPILEGFDDDE